MLGGALVLGLMVPLMYTGALHIGVTICVAAALWILSTHLADLYRNRRNLTRSFLGMSIAHMGFAITVIGVTITSGFSVSQDLRLTVGDEVLVGDRTYVFEDLRIVNGPNYVAHQAQFAVGDLRLLPERRQYTTRNTVTTEAAIRPGFTNDLLVSLGEPVGEGAWAVRIQEKPLIRWVWLGAFIAAIAGLLAVLDVRYRRLKLREARLAQGSQLGSG